VLVVAAVALVVGIFVLLALLAWKRKQAQEANNRPIDYSDDYTAEDRVTYAAPGDASTSYSTQMSIGGGGYAHPSQWGGSTVASVEPAGVTTLQYQQVDKSEWDKYQS
jgi:hypothetical protein